jgi:hypothetical protein
VSDAAVRRCARRLVCAVLERIAARPSRLVGDELELAGLATIVTWCRWVPPTGIGQKALVAAHDHQSRLMP